MPRATHDGLFPRRRQSTMNEIGSTKVEIIYLLMPAAAGASRRQVAGQAGVGLHVRPPGPRSPGKPAPSMLTTLHPAPAQSGGKKLGDHGQGSVTPGARLMSKCTVVPWQRRGLHDHVERSPCGSARPRNSRAATATGSVWHADDRNMAVRRTWGHRGGRRPAPWG